MKNPSTHSVAVVAFGTLVALGLSRPVSAAEGPTPVVVRAERFGVTPPLSKLAAPGGAGVGLPPAAGTREMARGDLPRVRDPRLRVLDRLDPVVQRSHPAPRMPAALTSFEGVGNIDGVHPPDPNIDVGPNHVVEMVNLHFCIYDKITGTNLIAPRLLSSLFAAGGFGPPASTSDDGDPIVLYDHLANRWLLSQFIVSVTPCHEVIAISQTPDPTGAWYLYDFVMPNTKMNDYPHLGVWPDGYYMTDNQFSGSSWGGAGVFAFDRAKMLAGDPTASYQYFDLYGVNANFGGMLPADLDGPAPPAGTPNYFAMIDDSYVNAYDAFYIWEFHVDWTTPANSTFGLSGQPNYTNAVAAFDSAFSGGRNNIPQPGTSQKLDAIADRLMHRLQYRYLGGADNLVVCHTVDENSADHAGVRYYHMRRSSPSAFAIQEQATFAPDANHRWMGSAAMDMLGNLCLGYSVSGTGTYPSIRYAGRLAGDPTGGMFQGEAEIHAGTGSQTSTYARWGDYTALVVDPADGVTFWYVNEYLVTTSYADWHTRIGSFRLGSAEVGVLQGRVTNLLTGAGVEGATVQATNGLSAMTAADGSYSLQLPTGTVVAFAFAADFTTSTLATVQISLNATTAQDFGISPIPLRVSPASGVNASGMQGGPYVPSGSTFTLSNGAPPALTWTAQCNVSWLTLAATGGVLAGEAKTSVAVTINHVADFLPVGAYTGRVVFSNCTGAGTHTRQFTLRVDPYTLNLLSADFSAGLPAGWVVTNRGAAGAGWRFDDPGVRGNLTGGQGAFAIADSDYYSNYLMDTELRTSPLNLAGYGTPTLTFRTDYYYWSSDSNEVADVDMSLSGPGGPWTNLWQQSSADLRGPTQVSLSVPAAAGAANVLFRFRYHNAYYEWWWQVDDVAVAVPVQQGDLAVIPGQDFSASGYHRGPFTGDRLYLVTNRTASAITWTALVDQAWISSPPAGGVLPAGGTALVSVAIGPSATNLPPGAYAGHVTFSNLTAATAEVRQVHLTVLEPVAVSPDTGYYAAGLEGGPFSPSQTTYVLTNQSASPVTWAAGWNQVPWLTVVPASGLLASLAGQTATVTPVPAQLTVPGLYTTVLAFTNLNSGGVFTRGVTVSVVEITGEITVEDTVAPAQDLQVNFGTVTAGTARTEHITVRNDHPTRTLIVNNIFFGYYSNGFDTSAADWREDVDASWNVAGGVYLASNTVADFMTSLYTNGAWVDASFQADVRSVGTGAGSGGVILRASSDLDLDGTGNGYLFLVSGGYYSVFRMQAGAATALQGWTTSTTIRVAGTNVVRAIAQGSVLRMFINGTFVWQGADTALTSGHVGLSGYSTPATPTIHSFDRAVIDIPQAPLVGISRKQIYLNSQPQPNSRIEGAARGGKPLLAPLASEDLASGEAPELLAPSASAGPFTLTNLPPLPATLVPGASFTFDARYAPTAVGSNSAVVTIDNNDNNEPRVPVLLAGRPAGGRLIGQVTAAHSGAPLAGAVVTVFSGGSNTLAVTDAGGWYAADLLVGVYSAQCAATYYATASAAGLTIAQDQDRTQHWSMVGSLFSFTPTSLQATVRYGMATTLQVTVSNTGPLGVDFQVAKQNCQTRLPSVSLPPASPDFPRGPEPASITRAPAKRPLPKDEPGLTPPSRVKCYGVDMLNNQLAWFYSDTPQTLNVVAATDGNLYQAMDFLNGDFTKLYALDQTASAFVWFNTTTGARTLIASITPPSGEAWVGMAGDPTDGALYIASTSVAGSSLYRINPATGALTYVGVITGAPGIIGIAISSSGEMFGLDISLDALVRINKATGAATTVGSVGFDASYAQGMDFDEDSGTLYLAAYNNTTGQGELRMADTQTGATTLVGAFQGGTEMCMAVAAGGSRCDWLQPTPVTGTVAAAASAPLSVRLDAATLPEQPSTNTADLVFTGTFVNSPPPLPVTFLVIPGDLGVTPAGTVTSSGTVGGPFAPVSQVYTLTNGSAAPLTWSAASTSAWLLVAPTGGLLAAGGTAAVTASLNEAIAAGLSVGDYTGRVAFTNHTGGEAPQRPWLLRVGAAAPLAIYSFPLDTDPGWTREGQWAFGKPQALGGDPATGHTGTNVFGYNLAGAYPNSMPVYYLTTGPLDFTGWTGVTLRLWRWLGVEAAVYDDAGLEISTNGVTWLPVWTHTGASFQDTAWQEVSYSLSAYADQCPNVRLRWSMGPTDSSVTYSGWNIDDITLEGRSPQTMAMARLDATPSAQSVPENAAAATVTVVRSQATTSEVSVAYATSNGTATAGEDYVATTGVLSFAANQTSAVVVISLLDDLSPEGDETFQLRLSQPSSNALLGTAEATITLLDGETPDLVRFAAATQTVGEAAITVAVAVVRSGPNGGAFSVPYAVTGGTAVAGADYLAGTGVVAFGAGQNTQFLGVVLLDDAVPEPLRTVLVNLGPPVGGPVLGVPTQQVIQIVDDEGAVTNLPLSLYDGGAYLWDIQQNGSIYNGSSDAYDTGLVLAGFPSFPNALLIGGREVLIGTSTSGALRITRRIYVPADQAYARFLEIMVNTAPTAVTVTVELDTNLGSDSSTISVGTSDGDTVFTTNDDWIVTDDTDGSGDPTVLQVVANGGGLIRPYAATQSGDSMSYDYRWTLGPGETGIVMHVAAQNPNRATALAKGPQLAALQLNLLAGLSSGEVSRIVNFGPSGVLAVLPSGRDYGAHPVGSSTDGDFVVTNTGAGLVTGTATASAPFSVVLGEAYSLPAGSAQVVRVRFSPVAAGLFSNTVVFTGGGGAVRPVSGRAIGLGDTDGDGFSDWNEYIAGTAETNAADYLHFLNGFTIEAPKRLVYEWDSVTGRWYTIIVCTNFKGGVWMPQGGLPGTGARVRVTNAPPDAWELGLRLGVELTP